MSQLLITSEKLFACRTNRLSEALATGVRVGVVTVQSSSLLALDTPARVLEYLCLSFGVTRVFFWCRLSLSLFGCNSLEPSLSRLG